MDWINTYSIFEDEELQVAELIQQRRLQLLVHSYIYYNMDFNVVSDKTWDEWAKELVQLQKNYPDASRRVMWYEAFADWDGSSGAFLPLDDPWVMAKAKVVSRKGMQKKNKKDNNIASCLKRKK